MAGLDRAAIDEYVVSERQTAIDELAASLAANELGGPTLPMRVEEGRAIRGDLTCGRGDRGPIFS